MDSTSRPDPAALPNGSVPDPSREIPDDGTELRGALVAGLIGAVVATAGYVIYNRLEHEQKEAVRKTVAKFVEERVGEVRSMLKM
jgi:hypothetical protein